MPILFLALSFFVSLALIWGIGNWLPTLPMVELALPIAALYLKFVQEWEKTIEHRSEAILGRTKAKLRGALASIMHVARATRAKWRKP